MPMLKLVVILGLILATCAFAPPDGTDEFTPPEKYRAIWDSAQACTGQTGDFDRITWYLVPGRSWKCDGKGDCIGYWVKPHKIFIASDWANIDWVIKHEMVHDLLQMGHDGGILDVWFWGKQCRATWGYLDSNDPNYRP